MVTTLASHKKTEETNKAVALLNRMEIEKIRLNKEKHLLVYTVPKHWVVWRPKDGPLPLTVGDVLDAFRTLGVKAMPSESGVIVTSKENIVAMAELGVKFPDSADYL